jgi:hypothetical protein
VLVLAAGLIPLIIFWVERRVVREGARRAPRAGGLEHCPGR